MVQTWSRLHEVLIKDSFSPELSGDPVPASMGGIMCQLSYAVGRYPVPCILLHACKTLSTSSGSKKLNVTPQEFVSMKMEAVAGTPLEQGPTPVLAALHIVVRILLHACSGTRHYDRPGLKTGLHGSKREVSKKLMNKIFK